MSDEDDEGPTLLVCARFSDPLLLSDNLVGNCDICNCRVQFRPHAPEPHILRCLRCVSDTIEPGDVMTISEQMYEDFETWRAKQRH